PVGGHNLLEPAAVGCPIVTGPNLYNAQEIADRFIAEEACLIVRDADELEHSVARLLADHQLADAQALNARALVQKNRGALERLLELVRPLMAKLES
ncbi:MAG: glycosyltransferase, partial [Pseudomonadota bacterium]